MTTQAKAALFSDPSNNALLRRLSTELEIRSSEPVKPEGLLRTLGQIVDLMIANPDKFDEFCSVNIEWIGQHFFREVSNLLEAPTDKRTNATKSVFTSAYRFLCELEFTQPSEPSFEVRKIMNYVHDNIEAFEGADRQQLVYAAYTMPAQVAKRIIGHPSIGDYRAFSQTVERSRKLKEEWDQDANKRQTLLLGLAADLKKLTSEYNFVGLVDGFKRLRTTKEDERKVALYGLLGIAFFMLALPLAQIGFVVARLQEIDQHRLTLMYSLPTIITIEVILLYLFRVVLAQFRSVKAQLLQVDLRISLCQFIQSYAEYVGKLREKDASALVKFEALIFSGLVTDEAGIPSTFDGVDQVATLIRSLRGSAKE